MSLMARLQRRWDARHTTTELISVEVDTVVRATRERVWSFIMHADSGQLMSPDVVNAFRVPGSPEMAVGEQHCTVIRQGALLAAHITEVVAIDPMRAVSFRSLTVPGGFVSGYSLDDDASGIRLTYRIEGQVAAGARAASEQSARTSAIEALAQIRTTVESGVGIPQSRA